MGNQNQEQNSGMDWTTCLLFFAIGMLFARYGGHIHILPAVMSPWLGMTLSVLKVIFLVFMAFFCLLTFLGKVYESGTKLYPGDDLIFLLFMGIDALSIAPMAYMMWVI